MSENVVYPEFPPKPGASPEADTPRQVATGGGGPHDPGMEPRIAALEASVRDLRSILGRMEPVLARVDERTARFATKEDMAMATGALNALGEKVTGVAGRLGTAEAAIDGAMRSAIGKAVSPWQLPALLASCISVVAAGVALLAWIVAQPWFFHR